ncbi:VOC family protein [Leifsonia xyli]|uniref:VOC family protein n=1 Tax=Leifsonia xyli TaxID=1575 RepID=UPI003D6712BF
MDASAIVRVGVILAAADSGALARFYSDALGFEVEAVYEDPAYVTLTRNGMRLSIAEQGHPAGDLPDVVMTVPARRDRPGAVLVIETDDCEGLRERVLARGAVAASDVHRPEWGGARCFVRDPEGTLIELEQPA